MSDTNQRPRKRRGFFSAMMSHIFIAIMAVAAFAVYFHQSNIKAYIGANVCRHDALGQYADGVKVPPISLDKPHDKKPAKVEADKTPVNSTSAESVKLADNNENPPPPPEPKIEAKPDLETGWREARNLFWRASDKTEAAYEKLVDAYPDNADLIGELGNVYYKNGNPLKAAGMYFQAGELFIKAGNIKRARDMAVILTKLAPGKAKELQAAIE